MIPLFLVVTLNIWGLPDVGFKVLSPLREERVRAICETLKRESLNPEGWDVVLLQEVWVEKDRKALQHCGYPQAHDPNRTTSPLDSGLLFLSKYPIFETHRITYPSLPADSLALQTGEAFVNKSAQLIRIQHPLFGPIWIGNTHLVAQYSNTNDVFQRTRLEQFRAFLKWANEKSGGAPLILGGDWNFGPGMALWESASPLLKEYNEAPESKTACTICPPNPMHTENQGKVDHLFASRHFQAQRGEIVFENPIQVGDVDINVSDHFGWSTSFRFFFSDK